MTNDQGPMLNFLAEFNLFAPPPPTGWIEGAGIGHWSLNIGNWSLGLRPVAAIAFNRIRATFRLPTQSSHVAKT
jgi:hypothetical protein